MSKVLLFWEKAIWQGIAELQKELKRFNHTCISFDVKLEVIDKDGSIEKSGLCFPFKIYRDFYEIDQNQIFVLLEPKTKYNDAVNLNDFEHDDDYVYVIGSEYMTLDTNSFSSYELLSVESLDERPLWGLSALSILLYDRMIKYGSRN